MPIKIIASPNIKLIEEESIIEQNIQSVDLMERAGTAFTDWITQHFKDIKVPLQIFCGTGNNGGDGLVIARLLTQKFYTVQIIICHLSGLESENFKLNKKKLPSRQGIQIFELFENDPLDQIPFLNEGIVIDALLGTGTNRKLITYWQNIFDIINTKNTIKIAVDIPSGMPSEVMYEGKPIACDYTISFQCPKLSFFIPESAKYVGDLTLVSIGLSMDAIETTPSLHFLTTEKDIQPLIKKRNRFSNKNNFGHALIIAGSTTMPGAASLAGRSCMRSGAGLCTIATIPDCFNIILSRTPELMCMNLLEIKQMSWNRINSIAIGPGLGQADYIHEIFDIILNQDKPMVIDADGLNFISKEKSLLNQLKPNTILTPHIGEFDRLFGPSDNGFERLEKARSIAQKYHVIIILKGANTAVVNEDGCVYFNQTGNSGMATAGSGDVLTGIIAGLLAQSYQPLDAALTAVWIHGLSGDHALQQQSVESLIASDIIDHLGQSFNSLKTN
ncbi:MAG TPA: NAD(P)H-hydrate dehydratase [Saprospiraceae bacterium]|nr:NAD(P)H-hydrate dehydratase [Saprospiraceae bacterium]